MTDVLSRELPAPIDWPAFERLSFDLFRRMWKTNDAEMHGRRGQPQAGVDVYGQDRVEDRFVGVQCKGKDAGYGAILTEKELRDEVGKALNFQPPIEVYVVVTTAPNDRKIQKIAREITIQHKKEGKFEVRVTGWDTLKQYITDFPDLLIKHFRDFAPVDLLGAVHQGTAENRVGFSDVLSTMNRQYGQILLEVREARDGDDPVVTRIAEISKLTDDGSPSVALKSLNRILEEETSISPRASYRLYAAIGGTELALGREARAIECFRRAHAADPDYPPALAILATVLLMEGKRDEARDVAHRALSLDPESTRAGGIVIDAASDDSSLDDIENSLPENFRGKWEARLGLSIRAHHRGLGDEALRYAEEALALAPDNWRTQSGVGEALIAPLATMDGIQITRTLPPALRVTIVRAADLLRRSWASLMERESSFQGRHVAPNLIALLDLLGECDEADRTLDQAFARHPDYAPLIRRRVHRLAGAGEAQLEALLDAIPETERGFEDWLVRTQVAIRRKDVSAARRELAQTTAAAANPEQREYAIATGVEIDVLGGASPIDAVRTALEVYPRSILIRSIVLEHFGEEDADRDALLDELSGLIDGEPSPRERFHAADAFFSAGRYLQAAGMYGTLHGRDVDSFTLRQHLYCLYLADRRQEARELYEALPLALRRNANYVSIGINIYQRVGLLQPALSLLENIFAERDSLRDRIVWLSLRVRLNRMDPAKSWLRNVAPDVEGEPWDLITLAQLIDRYLGGDERGLAFGYRALREGYNDPQIHLAYSFGLFINGPVGNRTVYTPEQLVEGAAIVLKRKSDGEFLRRVVELGPDPRIERDEIGRDNPLCQKILGLAKGQEIKIERLGALSDVYVVEEIQSRYVFALQRTLREFQSLFPGNSSMGSIAIEGEKGDTGLKELLERTQGKPEDALDIEKIYRDNLMPMVLLEAFIRGTVFDLWEAFAAAPGLPVKVAVGLGPEFDAGRATCADVQILIVDALTIYSWSRLGLLEVTAKGQTRLAVVQSTLDVLRLMVEERRNKIDREIGSFGWDGTQYCFIKLTPEAIEEQIRIAEKAAEFAASLRLVPAESHRDLPDSAMELFNEVNISFVDTLIAASALGNGLLADDLGYRVLAQGAGIRTAWTQTFIQSLAASGVIPFDDYFEAVGILLESGYDFTLFGHLEIMTELERSDWVINSRISSYVSTFSKTTLEESTVAIVLAQIVFETLRRQIDDQQSAVFHKAIATAMRGAGQSDRMYAAYRAAKEILRRTLTLEARRRHLPLRLRLSTNLKSPRFLSRGLDEEPNQILNETFSAIERTIA